jgi:hypothetical protein
MGLFSSRLQDDSSAPQRLAGGQAVQDALQRGLLGRGEVQEGDAALVSEELFPCGALIRPDDGVRTTRTDSTSPPSAVGSSRVQAKPGRSRL